METLGIMDPVETKSKEEMEKNAVEHFMKTGDRDEEGRYTVKLPWIEAKEIVQDNRSVAEQHHPLVKRLIFERHLQSSHAGTQVVLKDIRQKFWLLRGRKTVQRVISKFVRCKRYAAKRIESIPAPLPEDRVREALVFEITGVDLAGSLHLRDGKKAWILLFTCPVYRAIHLELIQSLSTNGFLLGFRRFIARRGRPKIIYSDNGTNFTGANNWISALDWDRIVDAASVLRIQWKFNPLPPTTAWWGGFWERLIQMVKKLLRRVLGKAFLYYEEIFTILCDIDTTINSRPLNCLSEDLNDLTPLTPSMFIQEIRTVRVPDLDNLDKINISKRYQYQHAL
ncbi:integrase catalytic domain-containing protein [Trichonephila clavipes]|nr:integrase catalytic domain-containing protein [Trichonephila clavipes]